MPTKRQVTAQQQLQQQQEQQEQHMPLWKRTTMKLSSCFRPMIFSTNYINQFGGGGAEAAKETVEGYVPSCMKHRS